MAAGFVGAVDRYFGISRTGSSFGQEIRAGLTTFLTMAYILFVNPDVLSKAIHIGAGANLFGQLLTATAIAAAVGTFVMGLFARYPFAVAPGMGLNAYFTYSVCLGMGVDWRTALGCVFLSGVIFVVITLFGLRQSIIRAIPLTIKRSTAAGIGLFLAIIGCANAGLVVANPATLVGLGDLHSPAPLLAVAGLAVMTVLMILRVRGAILLGILATTVAAIVSGAPVYEGHAFAGFNAGFVRAPVWPVDLAFHLDVRAALSFSLVGVVFSLFFVDFFDTAGTLVGLSEKAGFTDGEGNLPRGSRAFFADGFGTAVGALFGTSSVTSYIESMAGIEDGGRTGLTAVTVATLFLVSLFLWPLAAAVPSAATSPALILVGAMMMGAAAGVDWNDMREAVPAFITMIAMPLTYSIANGIAFGIIAWTAIQALTGRARKVHWVMYLLTVILLCKYSWD